MAFDGIVIADLVTELNTGILDGRISKIAQPEADELLLTIKGNSGQRRLLISVNASLPLMYFTDTNKQSPITAPNFCMVLRKHIANGRIVSITQPEMERIVDIEIEHLNELGDLCRKKLIVELMGKHSNIIFCDENGTIIDSIKHISAQVSSLREVLPGREYFIPKTTDKLNPLNADQESFLKNAAGKPCSGIKAIYSVYTGISPAAASEICFRAGIDGDLPLDSLNEDERKHLANHFVWLMQDVKEGKFAPCIYYKDKEPVEFTALPFKQYGDYTEERHDSISEVLMIYYAKKASFTRIRQKSSDLRHIIGNCLDRCQKKYMLQVKQLKDTEKRDKYRIYGELLNAYGYQAKEGAKSITVLNYYNNEELVIPLDETLTALENAQKYFAKYNKLKRTCEALTVQTGESKNEIDHLESILSSLDIAENEDDLVQIREELAAFGYIRKKSGEKRIKIKSRPFHYISSDGFHIYVGKNNYQNDELTFKTANGNDWWFHAKGMPGSHVIVRTEGKELPDRTFEEAGRLAGYYSKGQGSEKVEIDYLQRKNVKKPNGAAPGFVIYYTNYSLTIAPDINGIEKLE